MSQSDQGASGPDPKAASGEDMSLLIEHLKKEEEASAESTLSSMDSLHMWIMSHPGLQQPGIYEMINQYGPALLQMLRRLIGL